ncbi:SDR family NAD(P)-dependent oxidoreductase [Candidatus Binatus sp.]|jgi:light-dependent protochlorophyllide reductase|uniref:SDR family NAD(P)-dependent oxidoreductase n=1 Tax=Candidatus Binatus sp. TaxID=2811406 RepID=UPI003C854E00
MNTAIVTGANTGLGFECARALVETHDWHVIIACRSAEKGREAVKRLSAQTGDKKIKAMTLDLASLESVRNFARDYAAEARPSLRAIVCNAATQIVTGRTYTKDGFETTFAVNHLGHFLLVNLMLAQMAPPARIVVVGSGTHDPAQTTGMPPPMYRRARFLARPDEDSKPLDDPNGTAGRRAYTTSKLCNLLFAYELDRRLRAEEAGGTNGRSITVNAFDPGLMPGTGLARDYGMMARFAWRFVLPVLRPFVPNVNSVARSGRSLANIVTDPRLERISGKYFQGTRDVPSSKDSYDPAMATDLWETSASMVKLTPDETILRLKLPPSAA